MSDNEPIFYRRNLPHIHPKGAIFFITFRLVDSLPADVLQKLQQEREEEIKQLRKKYSGKEFEKEARRDFVIWNSNAQARSGTRRAMIILCAMMKSFTKLLSIF